MFFEEKIYFYGLFAVVLVLFLFIRDIHQKKIIFKRVGTGQLIQERIKQYSHKKFLLKHILLLSALTVLLFCVANLQSIGGTTNITRNGVDMICMLDVSKSMLAGDVAPSRLERAKHFLIALQEKLQDQKVGLILFSGNAYVQMPLTADGANAKLLIENASPSSVPSSGTKIEEALALCQKAFETKDKRYKVALLISDGENHEHDSKPMAKRLRDSGIVAYTIGIGTKEGATIPDLENNDFKKDKDGKTIITKLEEEGLKDIASITNGKYFHFTTTNEVVQKISNDLASMHTKKITDKSFMRYTTYYHWFAITAFLLMVVSFFISNAKKDV
jgi:Ca-activated chloride channel family protein